eukprot:SAG31_NODE_173_length_21354_cov_16.826112_13_plen_201_part_00
MNGAATLGRMAESSATEPIEVLRARLQLDGFLLLRGLLPRDAVDAGRRRIAAGLESAGWLAPGSRAGALLVDTANLVHDSAHPPANIGGLETQQFLRQSELVRVLRAPELEDFFTRLFGERSACFDFKWFRAIRPGAGQGFHCDNICERDRPHGMCPPPSMTLTWRFLRCVFQIWVVAAQTCTLPGFRGWMSPFRLVGWL